MSSNSMFLSSGDMHLGFAFKFQLSESFHLELKPKNSALLRVVILSLEPECGYKGVKPSCGVLRGNLVSFLQKKGFHLAMDRESRGFSRVVQEVWGFLKHA